MARYVQYQMLAEAALVEWERPKQSLCPLKYHARRAPDGSENPPLFQELSEKESYVKCFFLETKGKRIASPLPPKSYLA